MTALVWSGLLRDKTGVDHHALVIDAMTEANLAKIAKA